jgi:hypothetical protein
MQCLAALTKVYTCFDNEPFDANALGCIVELLKRKTLDEGVMDSLLRFVSAAFQNKTNVLRFMRADGIVALVRIVLNAHALGGGADGGADAAAREAGIARSELVLRLLARIASVQPAVDEGGRMLSPIPHGKRLLCRPGVLQQLVQLLALPDGFGAHLGPAMGWHWPGNGMALARKRDGTGPARPFPLRSHTSRPPPPALIPPCTPDPHNLASGSRRRTSFRRSLRLHAGVAAHPGEVKSLLARLLFIVLENNAAAAPVLREAVRTHRSPSRVPEASQREHREHPPGSTESTPM